MSEPTLADFRASPELYGAVLAHAQRGLSLQLVLRGVLVVFVALTVIIVPPVHVAPAADTVLAAYALVAVAATVWTKWGGAGVVRFAWLVLFADLAALASLALLTGVAARQSWTSDVLVNGFFLIPVIAATQLRPGVCAAVVAPTAALYLGTSIADQTANSEPWSSILLRTFALIGLGVGCVALSRIQRSRVLAIGGLLRDRTGLLADLMDLEARERRGLSEHLHDGALQYVLAARHDVAEARETGAKTAFTRLEQSLMESSRLLRSTVAELHPAVLEHGGLAPALRDLAKLAEERGGFTASVDSARWPDELRTPVDTLLFSAARELLSNVVKHAGAHMVRIVLAVRGDRAELVVADDGCGVPEGILRHRLSTGHIGLASYALRVEAAGGRLTLAPGRPSGSIAIVELPCRPPSSLAARALD